MRFSTSFASLAILASAFSFGAPTTGHAGFSTPDVSVSVKVTPSGSGFDWDYTISVTNETGSPINIFEIPEVQSGYLDTAMSTLPTGWTATEDTSPPFADPLIKPSTTPAAWLVVSTSNIEDAINYNLENNPLSFTFYSPVGGSVLAQFSAARQLGGSDYAYVVTLDPPTPSSVPEPATWVLMGLGALGLVALRRRKRPLVPARA